MSIFIPLWVFWIPAVYLAMGLIAYVPLVFWAARFIYPRRGAFADSSVKRILLSILGCMVIWPWFLNDLVKSEIIHRKRAKK